MSTFALVSLVSAVKVVGAGQPPAAPVSQPAALARPDAPMRAIELTNADRLGASISVLESFGTRHTQSDAEDPIFGIGAARKWIKGQFDRSAERFSANAPRIVRTRAKPGEVGGAANNDDAAKVKARIEAEIERLKATKWSVSLEEFKLPEGPRLNGGATVVNVVAVLPGTMPEAAARRYYIVGHYDSRNDDANDAKGDAPGANDDGSGTACVIEAARVMAELGPCDATIVFLATAGEEQGLLGAKRHAESASERGEKIAGVLSNDIVGDPSTPAGFPASAQARTHIRIFSEAIPRNATAEQLAAIRASSGESDSPSRQLARYVSEIGERYDAPIKAKLVFRPDRFLRGGDHSAFNEAGFAAVRFTEFDEEYARQHAAAKDKNGKPSGDRSEFVDKGYLRGVAALNIATLVSLANAPSVPGKVRIVTEKLENGTTLRWEASPEPDVAGYEVVWRETTSAQWTNAMDVGMVTTSTLNLCKDDWFFGVRAYDKEGYRSPVGFAGAAGGGGARGDGRGADGGAGTVVK